MIRARSLAWAVLFCLAGLGSASAQPSRLACPDDMIASRGETTPLACTCQPEQLADGTVWGTDLYTDDSRICRAALHAGAIGPRGGLVRVTPRPGADTFPASLRNGIQSEPYDAYDHAYVVARLDPAETAGADEACPQYGHALRGSAEPIQCACSAAEAAAERSIWGTLVYTDDSAICRAARHAGVIGEEGGRVTVVAAPGRATYAGSTRNGIPSGGFETWEGSFRFEGVSLTGPEPCPDGFAAYRVGGPLTCTCTAEQAGQGAVWGWGAYTDDSAICRAALHAGAIGPAGGSVTVEQIPGQRAYFTGTRNGVRSEAYGPWAASFRFAGVTMPPPPPQPVDALLCPENFNDYRGEAQPVPCLCPAEATLTGDVAGTDVYAEASAICRAALHAGAVGRLGGAVLVQALPGARGYAGSTRNGVTSHDGGPAQGSFRIQAARAGTTLQAPVQAPIAETLNRTGRVQLYIAFRSNSFDIDPPAFDVLTQLYSALMADPSLQLRLIGHTDNTGTPQVNAFLSLRRAEAVRNWLVSQGIPATRLATEGRGPDEPIADNNTDPGRALNRRVMAERIR